MGGYPWFRSLEPCLCLPGMLIGFVFWYRGLAQGGIAAVGQLQLLQPFFGLLLSALVLHESIGWPIFIVNIGVVLCVAIARQFAAK
ncbi:MULTISPECIES: EamA family transporter [unclassified Paenibacillus]|uniref:EamA family transporter n=1 Tax=unclassified Paenibacillus TaxID=185978 RepID=UPI003632EAD0